VSYPGKHFEIREHDAPTKYVWYGETRVARVTGSLSANQRVQRLRLFREWNLLSLAVGSSLSSSGRGQGEFVSAAVRWDASASNWTPVTNGQTLAAASVLWLRATTNATIAALGTYTLPSNQLISETGAFLPSAGIESWRLDSGLLASASLWQFEPRSQHWQIHFSPVSPAKMTNETIIAPGEALFLKPNSPAEVAIPEAAGRIAYYHQDHLGSSSILADADAGLLQETEAYPYGFPRCERVLRSHSEPYGFTQHELDFESVLHYARQRFYVSVLGRFISPDLLYGEPPSLPSGKLRGFLTDPQRGNLYGYVLGNPVKYFDPDGLEATPLSSFGARLRESKAPSQMALPAELMRGMNQAWDSSFEKQTQNG